MPNLTVSIPHQLGREEARRRIETQLAQLQQQYGSMLTSMDQRWTDDTLDFTAGAHGMSVTGRLIVEEQRVVVEIVLPWLLGMFVGRIRNQIEQQGRLLLEHRQAG